MRNYISVVTLTIILGMASEVALAEQFSIEGPGWQNAPSEVTKPIHDAHIWATDIECQPYKILTSRTRPSLRFVISSPRCWGSAGSTLVVIDRSRPPRVLLNGFAYNVKLGQSGRKPDIVLVSETAADCEETHWHFRRRVYKLIRTVDCQPR
jgi:hypothetical protein